MERGHGTDTRGRQRGRALLENIEDGHKGGTLGMDERLRTWTQGKQRREMEREHETQKGT